MFLLHNAMLALYMLSSCVRLSVHLSVTRQHCTEMAKHRITQTTPHNSLGTLVFWCQRSGRNSDRVTPNGGTK